MASRRATPNDAELPDPAPATSVRRPRSAMSLIKRPSASAPEETPQESLDRLAREDAAKKGRPTPSRAEARAQGRSGGAGSRPTASSRLKADPSDKKAVSKELRSRRREQMAADRLALRAGDARRLPKRELVPEKVATRDYVDSSATLLPFAIPTLLLFYVLALLPATRAIATIFQIALLLLLFVEIPRLILGLKRMRSRRFPNSAVGTTIYGLTRAITPRRFRLPKPQVRRGDKPPTI